MKYYKGLGTSTGSEFKEYMRDRRIINVIPNTKQGAKSLDMVFNKKRASDRKRWLANYDASRFNSNHANEVSINDFIDNEMIHFSKYDNERSIPSLIDGLKTSQRKILFAAFKRNLDKEIKVSQFSGYVSEQSAYHHGETSLNGCIIGLA